jgi:hypothetical protein
MPARHSPPVQRFGEFDERDLTNLLYFWPHSTAASSGLDFQEGVPNLPVRRIELALRQLNAEADA